MGHRVRGSTRGGFSSTPMRGGYWGTLRLGDSSIGATSSVPLSIGATSSIPSSIGATSFVPSSIVARSSVPSSMDSKSSVPPSIDPIRVDVHMPQPYVEEPATQTLVDEPYTEREVPATQRTRGHNRGLSTPTDPNMRVWITPLGESSFKQASVVSIISTIIQAHFTSPWPTWTKVPPTVKEVMWRKFQDKCQWFESDTAQVRRVWNNISKNRFRDLLGGERVAAMSERGVDNIIRCRGIERKWIPTSIWDALIDNVWGTEAWQSKSSKAKANRRTEKEGSITKHTSGLVSFSVHRKRMSDELQRSVSFQEVFSRTHRRSRGTGDFVDNKSKAVSESYVAALSQKYGENSSSHPDFDPQVWTEVIGRFAATRTHVYGFGSRQPAREILDSTQSSVAASQSACGPSSVQPPPSQSQLEQRIDNLRTELRTEVRTDVRTFMDRMFQLIGSRPAPPPQLDGRYGDSTPRLTGLSSSIIGSHEVSRSGTEELH